MLEKANDNLRQELNSEIVKNKNLSSENFQLNKRLKYFIDAENT